MVSDFLFTKDAKKNSTMYKITTHNACTFYVLFLFASIIDVIMNIVIEQKYKSFSRKQVEMTVAGH